jgi:hypothetical protein
MSGGGSGNKGGAFSGFSAGNGGCTGNIYKLSIFLSAGTYFSISIGNGGGTSVANGGNTSITINSTTYTVYGGKNGSLVTSSSTAPTDITQSSSTNDFGSSIGLLNSQITSSLVDKNTISSSIISTITPTKELLSLFSNRTTQFYVSIPPLLFFCVGTFDTNISNSLYSSIDGQQLVPVGSSLFNSVHDIIWNSKMYLLASNSTLSNSLCYSYDGTTWIGLGTAFFDTCYTLCSNNNITIASGIKNNTYQTLYSYDCLNWFFISNDFYIAMTTFYNGSFIGCKVTENTLAICKSSDGITWTDIVSYGTAIPFFQGYLTFPQFLQISDKMYFMSTQNFWGKINKDFSYNDNFFELLYWDMFMCIASNNYIHVIGGQQQWNPAINTIIYTYDFSTFYEVTNSASLITNPSKSCWTGKMFIITSRSSSDITISYDGINWSNVLTDIPTSGIYLITFTCRMYMNQNPNNQIVDTNFDFTSESFQKNNNINISFKTQSLS